MGFHGVRVQKVPTSVTPPAESMAGMPVYIGSAPFHMSADKTPKLNRPVLVSGYDEAVAALGFFDAEGTAGAKKFAFSLCEAMAAHFKVGAVGPIVLINVMDPEKHKTAVLAEAKTLGTDGTATLAHKHPWHASVVVKVSGTAKVLGTDYTFTVNSSGQGVVARVATGTIAAGASVTVDYNYLTPETVAAADIIGGVDAETQAKTGLELIDDVKPLFREVPGQILTPGFSSDSTVKAVAVAKAGDINGEYEAMVPVDIPTGTVEVYSDCAAWKATNGYTDERIVVCWPMGLVGDTLYHLSTLVAARCMQTDADNGGIPFVSPSNKLLPIAGIALADGREVVLDKRKANGLNDAGIVTAINEEGWRLWGNRTAAYPGSTDPASAFISLVRMRLWNTKILIKSHNSRVDDPTNLRLIASVVESENNRLADLEAKGALVGGKLSFDPALNPAINLANGQTVYTFKWAPPPPAEGMTFNVEFDVTILSKLAA